MPDPAQSFLWRKMLERQRRWFQLGADGQPLRDEDSRFIASPANPLPMLNPFDKLWERRHMEALGVPCPKLIAVLTSPAELLALAPRLPPSWVLKPVGAAYSDGVFIVRDNCDVTPTERGEANCARAASKPLDLPAIVAKLEGLCASAGRSAKVLGKQRTLGWNLSAFLVEELVQCESGLSPPIDYRCYCVGGRILWVGVNHLNAHGQLGIGYVDEEYKVTEPIHDEKLIATFGYVPQHELPPIPKCWEALLHAARSLGAQLNVFAR